MSFMKTKWVNLSKIKPGDKFYSLSELFVKN